MCSKRMFSLLVSGALLFTLTACGPKQAPPSSSSEPPDTSVLAPVEPDPEPVLPYVNPLTGEGCAQDISQNRPVAIMLNNLKKALPQLGVSQADIIYEALAEGGITRMLGVFQSVEGVGDIGSVRSARDYYVSLALGHDAIFLHAGGSPGAYTAIDNWGVSAFDCVNGPYEGTLFWRDQQRRKNMGLEHKDGYTYPQTFLEEGQKAQGDSAQSVTITFSTYKTGVFTYDPDSGLYLVSEYGQPYVDGNTGEQVGVKNVLVLRTSVSNLEGDDAGRQAIRTTGTGEGLFFCDGTVQEITWSKEKNSSPLTYYTADGQPLKLGVGKSYVNLVGKSTPVEVA